MKLYDAAASQLVLHVPKPELPLLATVPNLYLSFPGEELPESKDEKTKSSCPKEQCLTNPGDRAG